ncbi:MAG: hypothetical protein JNM93_11310 [Bacteriovoracaceae bacterium]|nr:hypothetical protein [Bacteriovoracaceae bacterium]
MKRPNLVNFMAIESDHHISIRASLSPADSQSRAYLKSSISNLAPSSPVQSLGMLSSEYYRLLIIGFDETQNEIYRKEYESDSFGNFEIRFPSYLEGKNVHAVQAFELSTYPGLEILIGTFIPIKVKTPKKVVISDFDKTLVDTKYSSPRELYESLRRPVEHFPKVQGSIELIKKYIQEDYKPFILSASPHFYENAIRDWLYQHEIFTGNIILKDYRKVFSLFEGDLTPKDLKTQGFYKLSSLVSILLMTGIPDELVLMGDGFESDTLIYLTLLSVIKGKTDPWKVWNSVKKIETFRLTTKQQSRFLNKFYRLGNLTKENTVKNAKVFIRCKSNNIEKNKNNKFAFDFINQHLGTVEYYVA